MGKGKIKISMVKRSNHMRHKLHIRKTRKSSGVSYGMLKNIKNTKSFPENVPQKGVEPASDQDQDLECEDIMDMMDTDDIAFLTPSKNWESEYEEKLNKERKKLTKMLLPIKTKDGLVVRTTEVDELEEGQKKLNRRLADNQKLKEREKKKQEKAVKKKQRKLGDEENINKDEDRGEVDSDDQGQDSDTELLEERGSIEEEQSENDVLRNLKFKIGVISAGLLETPEMKVHNFKVLFDILHNQFKCISIQTTVRKLVICSLLEIFKDILPSYPIKHQESGVKLKKSTFELQNFEKSLLKAYKTYLQELEKFSRMLKSRFYNRCITEAESLGVCAVHCFCELLVEHPYFNFSVNIAQNLVSFLTHPVPSVHKMVSTAISQVLKEDKRGELSLNIVRSINFIFLKKKDRIEAKVISVLLTINLKGISMDDEKEAAIQDKKFKSRKFKVLSMSKRDRKRSKKLKELEQEMRETKAEENKTERKKCFTEIMNIIFKIFFHVLKQNSNDAELLSITLEGLSKFAHCINLEFFQDLVNVLNELLLRKNLNLLQRLHCVDTVFAILSGQGETLNIDPRSFHSHLYCNLLDVHIASKKQESDVLLKILEKAVGVQRRKMSLQKLIAFCKRMSTMVVNMNHGDALGIMKLVWTILFQAKACTVLLDTDHSCGNGVYLPEVPDPELCGANATVLWELSLLSRHYHPEVQRMAGVIKNVEVNGSLPSEFSKLSSCQIADRYDGTQMVFRPAVPLPKEATARPHRGRVVLTSDEMALYLQNTKKSVIWPPGEELDVHMLE